MRRSFLAFALAALAFAAPPPVLAQETSGSFGQGSVLIGYDGRTCDSTLEGAIRYNSSAGAATPPASGLVSHWKFDETSGATVAADTVGVNNGTLTNMDPNGDWVPGKIDNALEFAGGDDKVVVSNHASLQITGTITIAAWVNPASLPSGGNTATIVYRTYFMTIWNFNGGPNVDFGFHDGTTWRDEVTTNEPFTGTLGATWYHVAATYNDSTNTIVFYVNGQAQPDDGGASAYTIPNAPATLYIGSENGARPLDGKMDDLRIYNRDLSATEIEDLYNSGMGAGEPALEFCDGTTWQLYGG